MSKLTVEDLNVGDGVTLCLYSDRNAYTVIGKTAKTVKIQRDKATLLNGVNSDEPDKLNFSPGGFSGHTSGIQRWKYEADPNGEIVTLRMSKKGYLIAPARTPIIANRSEHYDFNF
jgi:hypothetical protein